MRDSLNHNIKIPKTINSIYALLFSGINSVRRSSMVRHSILRINPYRTHTLDSDLQIKIPSAILSASQRRLVGVYIDLLILLLERSASHI